MSLTVYYVQPSKVPKVLDENCRASSILEAQENSLVVEMMDRLSPMGQDALHQLDMPSALALNLSSGQKKLTDIFLYT